jgi:non-ribosomal peptide synthetase component F
MAATNKRKTGKAAKKKAPKRKSPSAGAARKKKQTRAKSPPKAKKSKAKKSTPQKSKPKKTKNTTRKVARAKKKQPSVTAPAAKPMPQRTTAPVHMIRARFTEPLRRASEYENVRALIEGQARKLGSTTFLIHEDDGREYSFEKLDDQTTRFANLLADLGAGPGQRVALIMANSPEFAFAFLGAMKGGYVSVPLNTQQSLENISFALRDCGASFVVTDAANWGRVREVTHDLKGLKAVLVAGGGNDAARDHTSSRAKGLPVIDLRGGMDAAGNGALRGDEPGWWDEAQIVYTSHDSGNPSARPPSTSRCCCRSASREPPRTRSTCRSARLDR